MVYILRLLLCTLCLGIFSPVFSNSLSENPVSQSADPISAQLMAENTHISPGKPFWVAIQLKIEDTWHAYWKNPGDSGMAPVITWNLPDGYTVTSLLWPSPQRFEVEDFVGFGYEHELILLAEITPSAEAQANTKADIAADLRWVVCSHETCLPGESNATLSLPISTNASQVAPETKDFFAVARAKLPQPYQAIKAVRKANLVELSFNPRGKAPLNHVDFFPEEKNTIDYKTAPLMQKASVDTPYTIILKETTQATKLKGILVLEDQHGEKTTYDIDMPISSLDSQSDISMNTAVAISANKVPLNNQIHNDAHFEGGVLLAIGFAFLGGLILNLMPCVLPVVSFKVLGFIKMAGESRRLIFQHGMAFAGGVLISFWVLAALLLSLQAYGRSVGWGFQLQEPAFVGVLAALLFLFALSLFGLFEMGTSLISSASQAEQASAKRNALFSSFVSGVVATAIATPCTGPFLGSAVGFAVTLPAAQAMLIFTSLGLGMASPYIALAAFPGLLRFMPRPGPWMVTFKELMGFFMMATVLWLLWVFSAQTGVFSLTVLLGGFFLLSVSGWIYGRWGTPLKKQLTRRIAIAIALVIFAGGSYTVIMSASSWAESMESPSYSKIVDGEIASVWEEFSPKRIAELREQGVPVFIDFTAKWCLICQTNHITLSQNEVATKFDQLGVVRMKADWTKNDPEIAAELRKFGRNSVPLYVLYGANSEEEPKILPQVLTSDTVLEALKQVEESSSET